MPGLVASNWTHPFFPLSLSQALSAASLSLSQPVRVVQKLRAGRQEIVERRGRVNSTLCSATCSSSTASLSARSPWPASDLFAHEPSGATEISFQRPSSARTTIFYDLPRSSRCLQPVLSSLLLDHQLSAMSNPTSSALPPYSSPPTPNDVLCRLVPSLTRHNSDPLFQTHLHQNLNLSKDSARIFCFGHGGIVLFPLNYHTSEAAEDARDSR